jgi:three-Cys-motif partner protein
MTSVYLQPKDDGLFIGEAGPWAKDKLYYLERYLAQFIVAMRSSNLKWRAIHYIDLFAGSGKSRVRRGGEILLGSPLLALTSSKPFDRYFFAESNPDAAVALEMRCRASAQYAKVKIFPGDANSVVDQIAAQIEKIDQPYIDGVWPSLNLAFLDPYAFELKWSTVARLGQINRMDLIIYYPQMAIKRGAPPVFDDENKARQIDDFFGDQKWREIYKQYSQGEASFLQRALIDHYKTKLIQLGYKIVENNPEPAMRNTKNAPLYRLLFMSKHELGYKFWKQAVEKDSKGQMRLF